MRASRLVQLLLLLQTNGKMTAARLADELEVSVRTIYRDIEALSGAGVPIYAEPGPGGGVRLVDGYRTRLTGLTAEEAEALALSGLPGAASELGLGTVLAAAQLKVDAALPPELRSRAVRMRERFHLDAPGWFRRDEPVPHLAALSRAVWEEQRVEIRYQKRDGEVSRVLDPLGLVLKAGVWYLVALSGRTRSYRTFRVGRVRSVKLLDQVCERPPEFDLARHWAEAQEGFLDSWETVPVRVRVQENLAWLVRHVQDPRSAESLATATEPDAEGWITFTLQFQSYEVAGYDLMRFGGDLEVLEPAEVRQAVADRAASTVARYTDVPA
ncbi:MAG TPA: YafY family protein [Acidimicrobiales bacterium]|nr:YafY family protein [Acidimicrobiales bacterium]